MGTERNTVPSSPIEIVLDQGLWATAFFGDWRNNRPVWRNKINFGEIIVSFGEINEKTAQL